MPTPTPYEPSTASYLESSDPVNVIKESFAAVSGAVTEAYSRDDAVSMGEPNKYNAQGGVVTYRGGPLRQNSSYGTAEVTEQKLTVERGIMTSSLDGDYSGFSYGSQPLIVKWYKNIRQMMNIEEKLKDKTAMKEVIFACNDGKIYFFDLDTMTYSRDTLEVGYPLQSTASLNPYGFPLLYVGQTESKLSAYTGIEGMRIYSLIDQKMVGFESGLNSSAISESGAIFSSPLVETKSDTLIYGADNGLLYTVDMNTEFDLENAQISVDPQDTTYGYRTKLKNAKQGIVSSVAAYGDYVYFGDKAGSIQCVDMNTMQCVWAVDMDDSVVASVSLECGEDGEVYLYAGNVVNKRERSSAIRLVKIDALTGEILWECANEIKGKYASKTAKQGIYAGLMGSPLVGDGDISDLVIFNVNQVVDDKTAYAVVYALDKVTGEEVWSQPLDISSVSSPVAVYQPDGKSYIILGDDNGTLRLMDGFTGSTIYTVNLGSAIQSTPATYGNQIVVGTKAGMIYFVTLE